MTHTYSNVETVLDFVQLVTELRHEQKNYFRSRSPEILRRCRRLEADVDRALLEFEQPSPRPVPVQKALC